MIRRHPHVAVGGRAGTQRVFGDHGFCQSARQVRSAASSDQIAYWMGRTFGTVVSEYRLYRHVRTRVRQLTENFGVLSLFLSIYLRRAPLRVSSTASGA